MSKLREPNTERQINLKVNIHNHSNPPETEQVFLPVIGKRDWDHKARTSQT